MSSIPNESSKIKKLIVIGTSTGGPKALQQLLQNLPIDFQIPIVIVQHMPKGFTASLAERLNRYSYMNVKEATDGEVIQLGTVYLGPGDVHITVQKDRNDGILRVKLDHGRKELLHRPSVDILFASIARLHHIQKIAVILTGMGRDGRQGIMEIKEHDKDSIILAESPDTAIIDGMPRAAINTHLVTEIVRLEQLGKVLSSMS